MISLRTGVYALLAVIIGVMLVGFLPGEISNLSATRLETTGKQVASPINANIGNPNLTNSSNVNSNLSSTTISGTKNQTQGSRLAARSTLRGPYADVEYYGLWGIGFVIALVVYLLARRMLT